MMDEILNGTISDDVFGAGPGDQTIYAGGGKDKVIFSGNKADYSYSSNYDSSTGATVTIVDNRAGSPDGRDTLFNIEVLQFADGVIDFTQLNEPTVNSKPSFLTYDGESLVSELAPVGTVLGTLSAYDADGDKLTYSVSSSFGADLRIEGNQVILAGGLDFEDWSSAHFDITVSDGRGGSTKESFLFLIKDEIELPTNTPPTDIRLDKAAVSEGQAIGKTFARLSAKDADGDAVTFTLKDNAGGKVQIENGQYLKLSKSIDYEKSKLLTFTVIATDANGGTSEQTFKLNVTDKIESITGSAKSETLSGGIGADRLLGLDGNDRLLGDMGNDILIGGGGGDKLYGGAGADKFTFESVQDSFGSITKTRDSIFDFSSLEKDRIDLSTIDANTKAAGNQAFAFIGSSAFHGKAGELRFEKKASDTYIYADVNGDKKADMAIHLDDAVSLVKGYFLL